MPKVKDRSVLTKIDLEKRYELALKGLEDGTYDTLAKAAQAHDLWKSSLGHCRNGRHSRQVVYHDQQIFTLTAEKEIVHWTLKLDDCGMPPRVDYLMDAVMELVKNEKSRQVQVCSQPQGKNPAQMSLIRRNWITRFLNRHLELALKFASCIDRQHASSIASALMPATLALFKPTFTSSGRLSEIMTSKTMTLPMLTRRDL